MRRISLLLFALSVLVVGAASPAAADGRNFNGQQAPELALKDGLNGASAQTTLASLRGKVVCLKFWLTHCPVCQATLPEFQAIHDRYGRSGVYCLGVVIDDAAGVGAYVRTKGWSFPIGCDPDRRNAALYGVGRYPADYVIGVDGVVRSSKGFSRETIETELRRVRVLELGTVPPGCEASREAVEEGNYGEALRRAETVARAEGASAEVKAFAQRLAEISSQKQDNRFARADALKAARNLAGARTELERVVADFKGTSLEARAQQRLDALGR